MKHYDNMFDMQDFSMGNQPRKSNSRRIKKEHSFKKFDREFDDFDHHRHSYKRAANKNFIRAQVMADQIMF